MRVLSQFASRRMIGGADKASRSVTSDNVGSGRSSVLHPAGKHPTLTPSLRAKAFAAVASVVAVVAASGLVPMTTTIGTSGSLGHAALTSATSTSTVRDITTVAGGVGIGQGTNVGQSPVNDFVDSAGNVYVADEQFQILRELNPTTDAEIVDAGNGNNGGTPGFSGDGGPATGSQLFIPAGGAVDADGNVIFSDSGNNRVRVVAGATGTFYGVSMTAGDIYTVVGGGATTGCPSSGGVSPLSLELNDPGDVIVDSHGNLVIADSSDNCVLVLAATAGTYYGVSMTTAGKVYTVAGGGAAGCGATPGAATSASLDAPGAITVDSHGNLIIADTVDNCIRVVAASTASYYGVSMTAGDIYTVAGGGAAGCGATPGAATSASLLEPGAVTVDSHGNLVIADSFHNCVRVVAETTGTFYGVSMATAGDIYTVAGTGTAGFSGDGAAATSAKLSTPAGVGIEPNGDLVIADSGNLRLRVVAATTATAFGASMTAGDIYTVAGTGTAGDTGDGGLATSSEICEPTGVGTDTGGDIFVADCDSKIRMVPASSGVYFGTAMTAGDVYTVAGDGSAGFTADSVDATTTDLDQPDGVAVDAQGNLVIADTANCRIRVVAQSTGTYYGRAMTAGYIYTVAGTSTCGDTMSGGVARFSDLDLPRGVAVDANGNLVIADTTNCKVKVVAESSATFYGISMTAGDIYKVAGTNTCGGTGDGGAATSAELNAPSAVAVDGTGNLVIASTDQNKIRVVAVATGSYYGVSMTAGDIYSIVGTGTAGYSGNGGAATSAKLDNPTGVAVDAAGNVVIADADNFVVRVVAESTATFYGIPMTAHDIYTVAGDGTLGYSGDGGQATLAEINPDSVAVNDAGEILISDHNNGRVREVEGGPPTVALVSPQGAALGADAHSLSECYWSCSDAQSYEPVDPSTGDFSQTSTDVTLPGAGVPLDFTRTYDADVAQNAVTNATTPEALGYGWSDNYGMSLAYNATTHVATVTEENGAQVVFDYYASSPPWWCSGSSIFCPTSPRVAATLTHNCSPVSTCTGTWTFTRTLSGSTTLDFSSAGALTEIEDAFGDTVTPSSYTGASCPGGDTCTEWTSSASGRALVLVVNGSGQLVQVVDPVSGLNATFAYSGTGCTSWSGGQTPGLCTATDPGSIVATYTYDSANATGALDYDALTASAPGAPGPATVTYNGSGEVTEYQDPVSGQVTAYGYAGTNSSLSGGTTTVTAYPEGTGVGKPTQVTTDQYSSGVLVSETTNGQTQYFYRATDSLLPIVSANGDDDAVNAANQTSGSATVTTDADGNTTETAVNGFNQPWCQVDAADYLNQVRCPPSAPTSPPAAAAADPWLGMTLNFYNGSDQLTATTDALGNTTTYSYTTTGGTPPAGLQYCSVDPVDYQASVTCPAYGATHVTGTSTSTFDSAGDLLSSTDADGDTTGYTYGVSGHPGLVATETDPDGTVTTNSYDSAGQQTSQVVTYRSYSASTITAYDANGRTYCSIAPLAYSQGSTTCPVVTAVASGSSGSSLPQSTIDVVSTTGFSTADYLAVPTTAGIQSVSCTGDTATTFTGCSGGSGTMSGGDTVVQATTSPVPGSDPWPGDTITFSDADGNAIDSVNPLGGVTQNAYSLAGQKFCTVAPFEYAASVTCPAPTSALTTPTASSDSYLGATITTYNSSGQVIQSTSPIGGVTLTTYDSAGNVAGTTVESSNATNAPNVATTNAYDADGNVLATTVDSGGPVAQTTLSAYDPNGNVYCSVSGDAYTNDSATYQCPLWQASWITDPPSPNMLYSATPGPEQANQVTTSFYDANGNLLQQSNADVSTTVTAYNGDGNPYCAVDGTEMASWLTANTMTDYPYVCPTTPPTSPPGGSPGYETKIYDAAERLSSDTDAAGDSTSYTYDADGDTLTTTDPGGNVTTDCYYWETSTCASGSPAAGGTASSLYSTTLPSSAVTTDTYFPGGAADTVTTASGTTTDAYDADGDVTGITYSATAAGYTTPSAVTETYNDDGSRSAMTDGTGTTTYGYDAAGDQTSDAFTAGLGTGLTSYTVSHTYYTNGDLDTVVYPATTYSSTPTATYTWNAAGNMASVTDWTSHTTTFTEDEDNNLTESSLNGTTNVTSTFDLGDVPTAITAKVGATTLASFAYTRQAAEMVGSETDTGTPGTPNPTSQSYAYDNANRVTSTGTATASYDSDDDPTSLPGVAAQSFNGADQLCWEGATSGSCGSPPTDATTYSYNSDGDRSVVSPPAATGSSYGYNQADELVSAAPVVPAGRLATGASHSVVLRSDGSVWATGANADGQLGNGTTTASETPVEVSSLSGVTQVAAGSNSSYALTSSGTVSAWGYGSNGELGNGATANSDTPVTVSGLSGIVAIAAGDDHGLALTSTGTVEAWGLGTSGQLGNGTTSSSDTPVSVSGLTGVVAIAAGANTSYALTSSGTVYAWGFGTNGELGNGTTTSTDTPGAVSGLSNVTAIAAGADHALALGASGTVSAWGLGTSGQLGNGATSSSDTPVSVSSLTGITAVAASATSSYARGSAGTEYSWGAGGDGQLGDGGTSNTDTAGSISGITVASLSTGPAGSAALVEQPDASVYGFGLDSSGQLGNDGTTNADSPTVVFDVVGRLATGASHSVVLRSDGSVWATGANADGQLGNGTTTASETPVEVSGLSAVTQVAAGSNTSYALTSSGTVSAWGYGSNGELGNGATSNSDTPVSVSGLSGIVAIAAGDDHGLALTSTGTVEAWGLGTSGQLGNGGTTSSDTPVSVSGLTGVVAIAAGANTSYALTSSGTVYAWGFGTNGELGNGATASTDTPGAVSGLSNVTAIAAGADHALALGASGTVSSWGLGTSGQLGNGGTSSSDTPVSVSSLTGITAVAASADSSYARGSAGAEYSWGAGGDGQLGDGSTSNTDTAGTISGVTVASLSTGPAGSAALVEQPDASVYGYGLDSSGQLGNDGTTNTDSPTVVLNLAPATTTLASTYTYNGDGVRMSADTPAGLATFAWDTTASNPEVLSDGTYSYLYGPDGEVIEQVTQSGTPTFLVQDQIGSTRLLVNTSGSVVGSESYDAYGGVSGETGSSSSAIGFAGGYEDGATGFLYLIHRYYDPGTGEFVTVDPMVSQTMQPYAYAGDDVVNESDLDGLKRKIKFGCTPAPQCATIPAAIEGKEGAPDEAMAYLTVLDGLPAGTAAAIVGNLRQESQLYPWCVATTTSAVCTHASSGISYGIAQWSGSRYCCGVGSLLWYGEVFGVNGWAAVSQDLSLQLDYLWWSLWAPAVDGGYPTVLQDITADAQDGTTAGIYAATTLFCSQYERAGNAQILNREWYAILSYNNFEALF
jgi:RHS repeat-associated protein